jgi:hypothetical protein
MRYFDKSKKHVLKVHCKGLKEGSTKLAAYVTNPDAAASRGVA